MAKSKTPMTFFVRKEPQSVLKHAVLEWYFHEWCKIIANNFDHLLFVDGFSGPAYYGSGEECSPAIAARVMSQIASAKKKPLHMTTWHVEKDKAVYAKLLNDVPDLPASVRVRAFYGEFHDHLPTILEELKPSRCPAFFFVDPFGFTVDFSDLVTISSALKDRNGISHAEVLVNYATASIRQWLTAENSEAALDRFFGTTEWRDIHHHFGFQERPFLQLYERQLRTRWRYVLSVAIPKPDIAQTYFHLVFGTNNETAVRIMKHVMSKARDQGWRQLTLFEEERFDTYKDWIYETFREHRTIEGKRVIARALEQFDYLEEDAERAIRQLEDEGKLFAHKKGKVKPWEWTLMFDCH